MRLPVLKFWMDVRGGHNLFSQKLWRGGEGKFDALGGGVKTPQVRRLSGRIQERTMAIRVLSVANVPECCLCFPQSKAACPGCQRPSGGNREQASGLISLRNRGAMGGWS